MMQLYNIYITTGGEREGYLGANGRHGHGIQMAHLWIHNGEIKKNHSLESTHIDVDKIINLYGIGFHKNKTLKKVEIKEIYKEIQRLNSIDQVGPEKRLCKLFEEAGELSQAINKKLGRKVINETEEEIIELIREETADTIQCVLSFMDAYGMDLTFMEDTFINGSNKEDIPPEKVLMKLFKHIGCLSYDVEHKNSANKVYINKVISKAFILACHYGISESEVIEKIIEKNVKWEKVINKRINKKSELNN